MSDESPQKGWDSWFSAPAGSSEDERPGPEQSRPSAQSAPSIPGQSAAEPSEPSETAEPQAPEMSDAVEARETPEPEETPAEQTNWTVPSLEAVLEGCAPEQPQVPAQATPSTPDSMATQVVRQTPDSMATQVVRQTPEAMPTQVVPPRQQLSQPAQLTQPIQPPHGRLPEQSTGSGDGEVAPAAPTWQAPPPAQMWGAAPRPAPTTPAAPTAPTTPPASAAPADLTAPAGYPQPASPFAAQTKNPDGEWEGWDDQAWRRGSPPQSPQPPHSTHSPTSAPTTGAAAPPGGRGRDHGDETPPPHPRSRKKFALAGGIGAAAVVGLATVLVMTNSGGAGKSAASKPTPSGFQPTATTPAGDAQQTAEAFLAAWQSGDIKRAASYTDDPAAASAALTSYQTGLNLNGLQLATQGVTSSSSSSSSASSSDTGASPTGTATAAAPAGPSGSVAFSVAAKVGLPAQSASSSTPGAPGSASASSSGNSSSSSSSGSSSSGSGGGSASVTAGSAATATADWSYTSKLTAYEKNGGWWIKWDPALVAPNLTAGERVVSIPIAPTAAKVTDAAGGDLSSSTDAGVHNIAAALRKSAPAGQGTPGVEIELEDANGKPIAGTSDVLSQPVNTGVVKTTIDPKVETAAQHAVAAHADSSMVVIQPDTGDILAVANNDGGNDFALTARVAPGSTNKIVSSTALLTSGLISSPSQAVECPKVLTIDGQNFTNDNGDSTPPDTPFLTDFAVSCNDAFAKWYNQIGDSTLAQTAEKYYGLNQQWNIGLGPAGPYYQIPSSASNGELAQELFGQGQLEASPLAMASVAATVANGSFKQPIVVPGQAQLSATPLPSAVQQDLWQMMKAVTTQSGATAAGVFSGVNSTVYGKTGTADVGATQQKPNSWMVVFDPKLDVAIGCVVLDAGYGASVAGPETASVLEALQ